MNEEEESPTCPYCGFDLDDETEIRTCPICYLDICQECQESHKADMPEHVKEYASSPQEIYRP